MLRFNTGIHNFTMEKGKTMGHKNKPNRGSLVKQVQDSLDAKLQIGRKKKPDKLSGISQNYIYSWETYHSYLKHCCYFVKWCKENHGCKTIEQCKEYASEWMKTREHLSVYTQKMEASALVKLYGCTLEELNIHTAARQRKDITRSRNTVKRDRHFSESNHAELVAFCRATGLRRAELQALRGTALYQDSSGYYLHITSGSKGGRERYAPIIGDKDLVIRLCKRAEDGKVFEKIPSGADIHSYRRDYATAIYQQHARPLEQLTAKEKYYCRGDRKGEVFDRAAMRIASNALGHGRIEVIAGHYLKEKET